LMLKRAIASYLDHRTASQLIATADARYDDLKRLLATRAERDDPRALRMEAYRLFSECRFGYLQAQNAWAESGAEQKLRRAATRLARFELEQNEPESAAAILADVEDVSPALIEAIEQMRATHEAQRAHVDAL